MDNIEEKAVVTYDLTNAVRSPDFVSLYINNTRFGFSKWDIQMICGRVSVTAIQNLNPVEELAVIAMSPQHAKAVLKALEKNIEIYEAEHGEIIIPKDKPETKEKEVLASASRRKKK